MINLVFIPLLGLLQPDNIPLPPDSLVKLNLLARMEDSLFIYDHGSPAIWKFSLDGKVIKSYAKKGFGPNEIQAIVGLRIYGRHLYAADLIKRALHIFDLDLNPIAEFSVKGMIRDVLVLGNKKYLVMWLPKNRHMIQVFDDSFQPKGSFGTSLTDPRVVGLQAGRIFFANDNIVFSHAFLPFFEVFSENGKLLKRISIPGFDLKPLFTFEMMAGKKTGQSRWDISSIAVDDSSIHFEMIDYGGEAQWLYRYQWETETFDKRSIQFKSVHKQDGQGSLYRIERNERGNPGQLVLMQPFD